MIDSTNPTRDCDVNETIERAALRERDSVDAREREREREREYEWMSAHEHER